MILRMALASCFSLLVGEANPEFLYCFVTARPRHVGAVWLTY